MTEFQPWHHEHPIEASLSVSRVADGVVLRFRVTGEPGLGLRLSRQQALSVAASLTVASHDWGEEDVP